MGRAVAVGLIGLVILLAIVFGAFILFDRAIA